MSRPSFSPAPSLPNEPHPLSVDGGAFRELMMMYGCAIREVRTKLEVLNDECTVRRGASPIEFITTRVKEPNSIAEKLTRRGFPLTLESVQENLTDVAGVRVVCPFIDDIYAVAAMLTAQDDVTVLAVRDYIKNPKPNGYRSYHLIVEVPVFFSDCRRPMRVEVQIRTIAMDFWASLEHQMKYKKELAGADAVIEELARCAQVISQTDERMQALRDRLAAMNPDTTA